jgi:uncharacterized oligopeptide transporter (OPT) family protein
MSHTPGPSDLPQLTPDQIREWSLEQKDRWWLENVYKGDMPQLTARAALTGMLLGGVLSLTNLYVGVKTGWTLGVGITSVILAFGLFKLLSRVGLGHEMTVLENNAMQSVATAAGYMTGPLVSAIAAYMLVTGVVLPVWATVAWLVCLSFLGVLFAFPLKKRFINDEQLPFPEGQAAGVVMHALHAGQAADGVFKAKLLVGTGAFAGGLKLLQSEAITTRLGVPWAHIPEFLDAWVYTRFTPRLAGTPLKDLTVRLDSDFVMVAAGGLMGIRTGLSILLGAILNYMVLAPWMISRGDITGRVVDGVAVLAFKDITMWSLWGGVAMMTTASLTSFFGKPAVLLSSFRGFFARRGGAADPLRDIELPGSVFLIGIPVVGAVVVAMGWAFFGVTPWMGALAIPLVFVFTLIAVNATGLTSITPTSALGKLTQLTYGALAPGNVTTNLATAGITAEVASNAANLLMDIKPGYMLGAKPRQQALGHCLGIVAGALVAVPVFFLAFVRDNPAGMITEAHPFPSAIVWKAVAEVLTSGLSNLKPSAQVAAAVGAVAGVLLEWLRSATKGRFPISAVGLGLAFVISFNTCLAMFLGSLLFWLAGKLFTDKAKLPHRVLVENLEPTTAGIIAGGALMGIAVILVEVFVLGG